MQKIYYKGKLIGIKISKFPEGSTPHTSASDAQEAIGILTLKHKKGTYLKAHIHRDLYRVTSHLQEAFVIKKGKVRIDLYGPDQKFFRYIDLKEGELFLAVNCGHGFHFLTDCEMFEVKNGPFREDKIFLDS